MKQLKQNGYIIQRKSDHLYKGVDGDNWYLNYASSDPFFEEFYNNFIDKSWENEDFLDCCTDEEYVKRYIEESDHLGIEYRVLLCSSCKPMPKINDKKSGTLLGYDYAYVGGSYYSSVLNDILSGRIEEFNHIHLNSNGLFATYNEAMEFARYREKLKNQETPYHFEAGEFVVYEVVEIWER